MKSRAFFDSVIDFTIVIVKKRPQMVEAFSLGINYY